MVSVLLLKDSAGYNGNGDYESKTVFDFGFQDYNGLYGTDFPVLPPDVGGSRTFQTITRTKNRKVVLLCETATETKPDGSALRSDGRKLALRRS